MKADATAKRRVGRQWQQRMPDFDLWRPIRLLRRLGPVLQGVTLDMASSGTEYFPTAHIHPLTIDFPVVSLMLAHRLLGSTGGQERISINADDVTVRSAAERLRDESPLSFGRVPSLDDIIRACRAFVDLAPTVKYGPIPELEQLILLGGYSGSRDLLTEQIEYAEPFLRSWPSPPHGYETASSWLDRLVEKASDATGLQEFVETQAAKLKVDRIRAIGLSD